MKKYLHPVTKNEDYVNRVVQHCCGPGFLEVSKNLTTLEDWSPQGMIVRGS